MAGVNVKWEKYGCNYHDIIFMEVNVSTRDTKQAFTDWFSKHGGKYWAVWSKEGGRAISDAVGNGGTGNPKYIIYPDKTFKRTEMIPAEVPTNNCDPVSLKDDLLTTIRAQDLSVYDVNKTGFTLNVANSGNYSVAVYTVMGQKVFADVSKNLSAGANRLSLNGKSLNNGIYFLEIGDGINKKRMKMVIK